MIVVTAATKGGASKTTTAVCLAYEASEQGLDAVLVDLDPQGAGAKWAQGLGIPAPHVRNAKDVQDACASHDLAFVDTPPGADPRTVAALEAAYAPEGVNLGTNLGQAAGAGIPRHLHLHALPRWFGDTNFMTAVAGARVLPETLGASWERLHSVWPD